MGSGKFLSELANHIDVIAGPVVTLVYPLIEMQHLALMLIFLDVAGTIGLLPIRYASIRAIETRSREDDQQWLTYWVLYSLLTLFELTFAQVLEWFPIWPYAKLFATCWLVLPYFNGASYVYEHFVRPFYRNPQTCKIWYIPRKKKKIFNEQDDILMAAERYIEENGTEAFQRLITRADRETRARRSEYMIFDDDYRY